ncbi:MAG: prepilin-type N-terminal cleavage/methylation domain-containing protein [Gemmatimonadota bacterium]|nr:prepilin-type N-terminal cleavage/methylation domain-containing protein [Gemmatimonadota bacterium]
MTRHNRPAQRAGMSLPEVLVALTILGIMMVGMSRFTVDFARTVTQTGVRSSAGDLVTDRIETIKANGNYATIESYFAGTEASIPGYPGFTRQTQILRVGGTPADSMDYKVITVSVTGPRLAYPARKTTVISSF